MRPVRRAVPAVVETNIVDGLREGDKWAKLRSFADLHPPGRIGQPQEIAEGGGVLGRFYS